MVDEADPHDPTWGESTLSLIERVQAGEDRALDDLYRRYLRPLQRFARGRLPPGARGLMDTEDIVQETLVKALQRIQVFEPEHTGAFQGYLRRAVLNRVRDEIRHSRRRPVVDAAASQIPDVGPSPLEVAISRENLARYEKALESLRVDEREAIIARLELGFSYLQTAAALGKPSSDAARMAVRRAVMRLAEAMSEATA